MSTQTLWERSRKSGGNQRYGMRWNQRNFMAPSSWPARGRAPEACHRAWAKARVSSPVVAEERDQLVGARLGVRPAELDQMVRVAAVEVEVGEEIRLARDAAHGVAERRVGKPRPEPGPPAVRLQALGRHHGQVPRGD